MSGTKFNQDASRPWIRESDIDLTGVSAWNYLPSRDVQCTYSLPPRCISSRILPQQTAAIQKLLRTSNLIILNKTVLRQVILVEVVFRFLFYVDKFNNNY